MTLIVRVPLRVSFCGGGTDVKDFYMTHGGAILSTNIQKYVYISLTPRSDEQIVIQDIDFGVSTVFHYDTEPNFDGLTDLARGCVKFLQLRQGVNILIKSDVAPGSGLGTSSAITVGILKGLIQLFKLSHPVSPEELSHQAYVVEREILGWEGGMQDYLAATHPGINVVDYSATGVVIRPLTYRWTFLRELQMCSLLCYTGMTRYSATLMSHQMRDMKIEVLQSIKSLVVNLEQAWRTEDVPLFARYIDASYVLKRQLHNQITNAEIDKMYDAAKSQGAWGGKLLGAGAGGYLLFFAPFERQQEIKKALRNLGGQVEPLLISVEGIQIWESKS